GDIEVIAIGLGGEPIFAAGAGTAVRRDPVAKARNLPDEPALFVLGLYGLPVFSPLSVHKHGRLLEHIPMAVPQADCRPPSSQWPWSPIGGHHDCLPGGTVPLRCDASVPSPALAGIRAPGSP